MKLKNKKFLIVFLAILIVLFGIYLFFVRNPSKEVSTQVDLTTSSNPTVNISDTTVEEESTDIFDAYFGFDIEENGSIKEPGHRFRAQVTSVKKGNAQGIVIVNDSVNGFDSGRPSANFPNKQEFVSKFRLYTKYDVKNDWYTILKAQIMYNPWVD